MNRLLRAKGHLEGVDHGQRILSLQMAVEIEDEEIDKFVQGHTQPLPPAIAGAIPWASQDGWNTHHWYWRNWREGIGNERGGHPDLVVICKTIVPIYRKARKLPGPRA